MSGKVKILATDGLAENGQLILKEEPQFDLRVEKGVSPNELTKIIADFDCIIIRSATTLTKELIENATNMKLIVRAGAGVDNIDVPTATSKKIPVMNTASANSQAAAEQTIALLFSMFRQIPQAALSLKEKKWDRAKFKGYEVTDKTLGVVGLGNIGRIVAEKAVGLGMNVLAYDPLVKSLSQVPSLSRQDESITLLTDLDELLPKIDVLTLHVPKVAETSNLMNADRLAKMKKGSFLINCSRGGIVDEAAVVAALDSEQLEGAAFDVFEKEPIEFPHPLVDHPKAVCVPHLGASTFEAQKRVASTAARQIRAFFNQNDHTGIINGL